MHTTFRLIRAFPTGFRSLEMVLLVTHVTDFAPGWACSLLHDVHTTAEFTFLGSRRSCRFCRGGWRVFLLVGPNSMDILCTISYAKNLHLFLSGLHGVTEEYGPLEIQVLLWYKAFPVSWTRIPRIRRSIISFSRIQSQKPHDFSIFLRVETYCSIDSPLCWLVWLNLKR